MHRPNALGVRFSFIDQGLAGSRGHTRPKQEIVSANGTRLTYQVFAERVGRLASGLAVFRPFSLIANPLMKER